MSSSDPSASSARDRIRDSALERFGRDGVNRVTIRAIAADAGVSPALVIHHFGSKESLRKACDAHVVALIRGGDDAAPDLTAMLESATPVRRYLARALLDGTSDAAALFDEIVELTADWLADGEREGWVRHSEQPHARAALYVTWLLAPLAFDTHLARVLGVADPHGIDATLRFAPVALDVFTHGIFTSDRELEAWRAVGKEHGSP
ncbi:TetR family transcriptional regulator [Brachybacterium sp. FME24]|uniref:TetR family transcriptional regulator n=1 Tax=Brachybacterium sp. FME24 TaxID=2742605 RepID=UPI001867B206|nr:TetR family transcriptional regulator [Brachybacterium sp. FME24]